MKCKFCLKPIGDTEITLFNGTNRVIGHFHTKCVKKYYKDLFVSKNGFKGNKGVN